MSSAQAYVFPEIEKLRAALFGTTGKSRATVLVGAGLSRQSEPLSSTVAALPLWGALASRLRRELGLTDCSIDALDLAQQFEERFGRVALDDLIIDAVSDGERREEGLGLFGFFAFFAAKWVTSTS